MPAEDNLATIKAICEAFGSGDVETILDAVTDDVDGAVDAQAGRLRTTTTSPLGG